MRTRRFDTRPVVPADEIAERDPWVGEDERWAAEDRADAAAGEEEEEDILAPARAVVYGLVLVTPLWAVIVALAYLAYRAIA